MLRLLAENENELTDFCERDVFGTRISACMNVYGTVYPFALFYLQENGEQVTAALCKIDEAMTLCCAVNADYEELLQFVKAVGFDSLICDASACSRLGLEPKKNGFVVEFKEIKKEVDYQRVFFADGCELADVYDILNCSSFDGLGSRSQWLSDVGFRVNRGSARAAAAQEDGKLVACAMVLFETKTAALIGAVATLPEYRGKGCAGALVTSLALGEKAMNKRVELLCASNGIVDFYQKIGFETTGEWALIEGR
jgi:GNAT superfamily N-acetyltransferase